MATERSITKDTVIPIGLVVGVVICALWLNTALLKIDARLERIEEKVNSATEDRWKATDMLHWTNRLRDTNPGLMVPMPLSDQQMLEP